MKTKLCALSIFLNLLLGGYLLVTMYVDRHATDYFTHNVYAATKVDSCNAVFLGNSITANWIQLCPHFFRSNNYLCRGIGGNTSTQMLLRFQNDVVNNHPKVVVISAGINDIASADGFYDPNFTMNNIKSMVDIAKANSIGILLTSVLPCEKIVLQFETINNVDQKVLYINQLIQQYSSHNHIPFVDYHHLLKDSNNAFNTPYTFDGLHPNEKGYQLMQLLLKPKIDSLLHASH